MFNEVEHLQSRINDTEHNLRIIEEQKDSYVDKNAIPLDLIKNEETLLRALKELRSRLEAARNTAVDNKEHIRNLPPIWNVPDLRNPYFIGRNAFLRKLHQALSNGPTVLHGMFGIGKTQLAFEYACRHRTEFDLVWWVRAWHPGILRADYAALAVELKLPQVEEREVVIQAVRRMLEKLGRWLLVFDGVHQETYLEKLLPQGNSGRVLITSRNPNWDRVTPVEVPLLARSSSVRFLLNRSRKTDVNTARELAYELGYLPLALELAAGVIARKGMTLKDYLDTFMDTFRPNREALLEDKRRVQVYSRAALTRRRYSRTLHTTCNVAVEQVKRDGPAAAIDLLKLCAFLAPEAIPFWFFVEHCDALPPPLREAACDRAMWGDLVQVLLKYALVRVTDGSLTFHQSVQLPIRDGLVTKVRDERPSWAEAAVRLVNANLPSNPEESSSWTVIDVLAPHALAAVNASIKYKVGLEVAAGVLTGVALHQKAHTAWAEAEVLLERAIAIDEKVIDPHHPTRVQRIRELGWVLHDRHEWGKARRWFHQALAMDRRARGGEHPDVALDLSGLGFVWKDQDEWEKQNKLDKALLFFKRALAINRMAPASKDQALIVARDLSSIAFVLKDQAFALKGQRKLAEAQGKLTEAQVKFEEALFVSQRAAPQHRNVTMHIYELGWVLHDMGKLHEAKRRFEEALDIDRKAPSRGGEHPDVARDLSGLGFVWKNQGELAEAEKCFERALEIHENAYGPNHPAVAQDHCHWASVLEAGGKYHAAKEHFEQAKAIYTKLYRPRDQCVIEAGNHLYRIQKAMARDKGHELSARPD